ncbi:MAG: glutamate--tRNA ligase [Candidatus Kariarchaeaceae archaeon]
MSSSDLLKNDEVRRFIRIQVLLNAKLYDGKPNAKAVLGKILGMRNELKSEALAVKTIIEEIAEDIAQLGLDIISKELKELAPEIEQKHKSRASQKVKKRKQQKQDLPELEEAVQGKVIVRYAPDPSKYPHLGQGMNYLINRLYAEKYQGKVVLRFDDTNPAIVAPEYYEAIKDGLSWLGATWDEEVYASSFVEDFYEVAKDWIIKGHLYSCSCSGEILSKNRNDQKMCAHRSQSGETSLAQFENMLSGIIQAGDAIVRLAGDMNSDNMVMRDPVMFRIVKDKHPLLKKFYPVFPTYDFESAYLEFKYGITHVIRSGEFGPMRQELQSYIIQKLGGKVPKFVSFGRFNIQGSPTKGRVIRELVQTKVVTGWDDIRLLTLSGLKKRGIHPKTAKILIEEAGLTPKNTTIAWQTLEAKSKSLLEPVAKRFFFVADPVSLILVEKTKTELELAFHPDHSEYGKRKFDLDTQFYLAKNDAQGLLQGGKLRLKDLFNIEVVEVTDTQITAKYIGEEIVPSMSKIHWVGARYIPGKLSIPGLLELSKGKINEESMSEATGYFETSISEVDADEVIQLERFGYAKISMVKGEVQGHIVHLH